ncbi:MAG: tRNA (adenosine(37)-N6)-dimethylallyltransferase MiaA [Bacteriovoracaceae bacterium]|jgi:tRNA dimethylallyltransferase|nr:tRNA (adenosine(37)-N6)-dimethylallyltransferase MiaA [Bacteriovoracaceae bacterium]
MSKKIIVISGPTASGKTSTSIELAKLFNAEIVNFDSLVFYKEISIGTAKPTEKEMQGIAHHLVGTQSIKSAINAADFQEKAIPIINEIHSRNKHVILVGGSGFYLQTLLKGMYKGGSTSKETLNKSNSLYAKEGITPFLEFLKENDPKSFERYHKNDHYRIRRAVEFFWQTNSMFSKQREKMGTYELESPTIQNNWDIFHCYLDIPKEDHFEIIAQRTLQMVENGLIEEVKSLLETGYSSHLKPLQAIGYKETVDYINGKFSNIKEYMQRISISTRQLAKSQRTWFNKVEKTSFHPIDDKDLIKEQVRIFLKKEPL